MRTYFLLQIKVIARRLRDFGIHPVLGVLLMFIVFVLLSYYLFENVNFAAPIYAIITLVYVIKLSEEQRNEFLKSIFPTSHYYLIRIGENLTRGGPFIIVLLFEQEFAFALVLLLISILLALQQFSWEREWVIPTPFYKRPFEFVIGFRRTFPLLLIAYFLEFIAIYHDNLNLGIFAIILIYLVCISYYQKPEDEIYIWSCNLNPQGFLMMKIKTAVLFSFLSALPFIAILVGFYPQDYRLVLLFVFLANIFLISIILAKYASYPHEIHLPYGILLGLSLFFPVLLFVIIPFLMVKAKQSLKNILV